MTSMPAPSTKVTILPLPAAADPVDVLRGGGWADDAPSAVLVAGPDAAAVGEAVARLRSAGVAAAGWIGDPSDPAAREMAAELFPGAEVAGPDAG